MQAEGGLSFLIFFFSPAKPSLLFHFRLENPHKKENWMKQIVSNQKVVTMETAMLTILGIQKIP